MLQAVEHERNTVFSLIFHIERTFYDDIFGCDICQGEDVNNLVGSFMGYIRK